MKGLFQMLNTSFSMFRLGSSDISDTGSGRM